MSETATPKRYALFSLGVLLLLLGGVVFLFWSNDFAIRTGGVLACMASAYLIRISNVFGLSPLSIARGAGLNPKANKRPGRAMWAVGAALLLLTGVSVFYLYKDALGGYHEVWPVYLFAGVAAVGAVFWSYLVSKSV